MRAQQRRRKGPVAAELGVGGWVCVCGLNGGRSLRCFLTAAADDDWGMYALPMLSRLRDGCCCCLLGRLCSRCDAMRYYIYICMR